MPEPVDTSSDLSDFRRWAEAQPPGRRRALAGALADAAGVLCDLDERFGAEEVSADEETLEELVSAMAAVAAPEFAEVLERKCETHLAAAGTANDGEHHAFCATVLDAAVAALAPAATCVVLPAKVFDRLGDEAYAQTELARMWGLEDFEPGRSMTAPARLRRWLRDRRESIAAAIHIWRWQRYTNRTPLARFAAQCEPLQRRELAEALAGGAGIYAEMEVRFGEEALPDGREHLPEILLDLASGFAVDFADLAEQDATNRAAANITDDGEYVSFCVNVLDTTLDAVRTVAQAAVPIPDDALERLTADVADLSDLTRAAERGDLETGAVNHVLRRRRRGLTGR